MGSSEPPLDKMNLGATTSIHDRARVFEKLFTAMMMKTFITRRGEGQGRTKKERKATKRKGSGLEEGASRALMRQYGEGGCGARG